MTGISETFLRLKQRKEGALIAYLTVGDPHPKKTRRLIGALIEGGADIIELGIPFSDPIADGPTIQNAVSRSLASGAKPFDALDTARELHGQYDTPLVLMTYFNPVYRIGMARFLDSAQRSGICGMIVPDLPVEEAQEYKKKCMVRDIDTIFQASPSTTPERLQRIAAQTSGFLYLVSLYGVTGARATLSESSLSLVKKYRDVLAGSVPLAAGFGISKPEHVKQVIAAGADGAIVGSAFVKVIEMSRGNVTRASGRLKNLARSMKKATDAAKL